MLIGSSCVKCDKSCSECDGITSDDCISCENGYQMDSNEICKECSSISGFTADSDGSCISICGDGILISKYEECDDSNLIDGDGCDSKCIVEFGYSPTGLEIIKPNYKIHSVSRYNEVVIL